MLRRCHRSPINRAMLVGCSSMRSLRMQTVCMIVLPALAGAAYVPTQAAAFLFALHRSHHRSPTNRAMLVLAALRCNADAKCVRVWPALAGAACVPTKAAAFLFALHQSYQGSPINRAMLVGCSSVRCRNGTCVRVWPALSLAGAAYVPTKAAAFLFALHESRRRSPTNRAMLVGCSSVRCGCKLCACLAGTRRSCLRADKGCRLPLCCPPEPSGISDQSSNACWLLFDAMQMYIVCVSGQHSQEVTTDKGCRLPLCFAPELSRINRAMLVGCSSVNLSLMCSVYTSVGR